MGNTMAAGLEIKKVSPWLRVHEKCIDGRLRGGLQVHEKCIDGRLRGGLAYLLPVAVAYGLRLAAARPVKTDF